MATSERREYSPDVLSEESPAPPISTNTAASDQTPVEGGTAPSVQTSAPPPTTPPPETEAAAPGALWIDCGTYWLSAADQRSAAWLELRLGRLTASAFGTAIGVTPYKKRHQLVAVLNGGNEIEPHARAIVEHGVACEPLARAWYEETTGQTVVEVGLAIPKWDPRIGGSTDGEVGADGLIEIKCPKKLYWPLQQFERRKGAGWIPPPGYRDHIYQGHYAQMQGCMAIMGRKWCDYIVYCTGDGVVFSQRIPFDENYWRGILYPGICAFLSEFGAQIRTLPGRDWRPAVGGAPSTPSPQGGRDAPFETPSTQGGRDAPFETPSTTGARAPPSTPSTEPSLIAPESAEDAAASEAGRMSGEIGTSSLDPRSAAPQPSKDGDADRQVATAVLTAEAQLAEKLGALTLAAKTAPPVEPTSS